MSDVLGPPPVALRLAEYPRAAASIARLPWVAGALTGVAPGRGEPVMLLPGLFNSDRAQAPLRRVLLGLGHDARGWGLGRNFGPRTIGPEGERLMARVERLAAETGEPVALVGFSLGGIMARLVARRRPGLVRQVVTVSAPFAGDPRATHVWRAFEWITGERINSPRIRAQLAESAGPLAVPSLAIWSRSDGLVNGLICRGEEREGARSLEVRSGHLAVQLNPAVMRAIAEALATGR